ncbi:hypothetical protein ACHAQJ_007479 [Trichoderma viride]
MAATPPPVISDLQYSSESLAASHKNEAREGIASVISTIRAMANPSPPATRPVSQQQSSATGLKATTGSSPAVIMSGVPASGATARLSPEEPSALQSVRSVSVSTSASNVLADNVTERSGSIPHSHPSQQQYGASPPLSEAAMAVQNHGAAAADQRGYESQNGTLGSSAPPRVIQSQVRTKAYTTLLELIRKTDPAVVRQVVRENWHTCLVGSDYHSAFIANAAITCCNPAVLSRTVFELGDKMVKTSKREIAKHFGSEDLDQIADIIGPKLSAQFQDRVIATRLETIGAQDLINALARAERLGYHVNDIVQKQKPGPGGESVIPSMSTVPPMLPHNGRVGAPPPPMPPYQVQGPPQQPHPYGAPQNQNPMPVPSNRMSHQGQVPLQAPSDATPNEKTSQSAPDLPPWVVQCRMCHRPCSSEDALNYHMKKARCLTPKSQGGANTDVCVHCGSTFESLGGLAYHMKSDVCGKHDEKVRVQMIEILRKRALNQSPSTHWATGQVVTPGQVANAAFTPMSSITPKQKMTSSVSTPSPSGNDPYAKLTPEARARFDAEMLEVDQYYFSQMQVATRSLPPGPREEELAKMKNRYNTKQSNTRKKYGIRLRERRANADAVRSLNTGAADHVQPAKKARTDDGQAVPTQAVPQVMESPRRRVPLSEMGGLSASSATAELVDPTTSSMASRPQPPAAELGAPGAPQGTSQGTPNDPMQIDDESSTDTDSDNVDIPARIRTT